MNRLAKTALFGAALLGTLSVGAFFTSLLAQPVLVPSTWAYNNLFYATSEANFKSNVNLEIYPTGGGDVLAGDQEVQSIADLNLTGLQGQFLKVTAAETGFEIGPVAGAGLGDVSGPSPSPTDDNAVVRWDGVGGQTIQNSKVLVSDVNAITGVNSLNATNNIEGGTLTEGGVAVPNVNDKFTALTGANTSAEVASRVSDETGTGNVVFSAAPTLTGETEVADIDISGKLKVDNAGSVNQTVTLDASGNALLIDHFINVVTYGADGSDGVDDRAALESAFQAGSTAKRPVFVPPGTYIIDDGGDNVGIDMETYSDVHIIGVPGQSILKAADSSVIDSVLFFTSTGSAAVSNITIDGIVFDGNFANRTETPSTHLLIIQKADNQNVRVVNCEFRNIPCMGALIAGDFVISDCVFDGTDGNTWNTNAVTAGIYVNGNGTKYAHGIVENTYFKDIGKAGSDTGQGIYAQDFHSLQVVDSVFTNCWQGVKFDTVGVDGHATLVGNTFLGGTNHYASTSMSAYVAAVEAGVSATITGNSILDWAGALMFYSEGDEVVFSGNTVDYRSVGVPDKTIYGIYAYDGKLTVANNRIVLPNFDAASITAAFRVKRFMDSVEVYDNYFGDLDNFVRYDTAVRQGLFKEGRNQIESIRLEPYFFDSVSNADNAGWGVSTVQGPTGLGVVTLPASTTQTVTAAGDRLFANAGRIVLNPNADYTLTATNTIYFSRWEVINGIIDYDRDGTEGGATDDGVLSDGTTEYEIIDGLVDVDGNGVIDGSDDSSPTTWFQQGYLVINGYVDVNASTTPDNDPNDDGWLYITGLPGQVLVVTCANDESNSVTFQDEDTLTGSRLQLDGDTRTISGKEVLELTFDGTDWCETGFRNETYYDHIYIDAGAFVPQTTNGATAATDEIGAANHVMIDVMTYLNAADSYAQAKFVWPERWDAGTIKVKVHWTSPSDVAAVEWEASALARGDDDAIDTAFPANTLLTADDPTTAGDVQTTAVSGAMTVGGTPAAGDMVWIRIMRDVTDASAGDADLLGVTIQYGLTALSEVAW